MGFSANVCKRRELLIEDDCLIGPLYLQKRELSSASCFKANISKNQKSYNFSIIQKEKTDNIAEYLTNIDKFLIIFYGKW